jgi:flagellar motor protein MotB
MWRRLEYLLLTMLLVTGCNQNPFGPGPPQGAFWRNPAQMEPAQMAQLQELDQRNRRLDSNNSELHKQLAQSQQHLQLMRDEISLLKKRLDQTANQLETTQLAKEEAERKVETLQASTRFRGGAMITANNSAKQALAVAKIPGLEIQPDEDVIRITIPADQLFAAGTVQWQSGGGEVLNQVAQAITAYYPRQLVAVEAHTDNSPSSVASSPHQLSASQALAVFQYLTERSRLPDRQVFTIAHGANQPLVSNGTPAGREKNRRIEIVIYPDAIP